MIIKIVLISVGVIAGLTIGYFLGSAHKTDQLNTIIYEVFEWDQGNLNDKQKELLLPFYPDL